MNWMPEIAPSPGPEFPAHATRARRGAARRMTALLVTMLMAGWALSASASTVLKLDLESLVANSAQILEGEVTRVEARVEDGKVFTYTTIQVKDGLKGAADGESVTIKQIGGRTETLATRVAGVPGFQAGERVVVFLEKLDANTLPVVTGMSQGKFHVALGPDNTTPYAVPFLGDIGLIEPATPRFERLAPQPGAPQQNAPQRKTSQPLTRAEAANDASSADAPASDTAAKPPALPKARIDQPNFRAAQPAEIYRRVVPLNDFKDQIRQVIRDQSPQ